MAEIDCASSFAENKMFSWQPTLRISHRKISVCSENNTSVAVNIRFRLQSVSANNLESVRRGFKETV